MELFVGDIVSVETPPDHNVGFLTLIGEAVRLQMKKKLSTQNMFKRLGEQTREMGNECYF